MSNNLVKSHNYRIQKWIIIVGNNKLYDSFENFYNKIINEAKINLYNYSFRPKIEIMIDSIKLFAEFH